MKVENAFLGVGLILSALAGFLAWKWVYEPLAWPEATATVMSSAVVSAPRGMYTVEFTFRYPVNGIDRDKTIRSSSSTSSYALAETMLSEFPEGARVPVRVKPGDPNHIAYNAGWSRDNIVFVSAIGGLAAVFLGIGAVARWWSRRDHTYTLEDYQVRAVGAVPIDDRKLVRRVPYVFLAIGLLLLAGAAAVTRSTWQQRREWPAVEAEVADNNIVMTASARSRGVLKDLSVRFKYVVDDRVYTRETTTGVRLGMGAFEELQQQFAPGTRHLIRHHPDNPSVIRYGTGGFLDDWFVPGVLGIVGLGFTGFGVLFLYLSRLVRSTGTIAPLDSKEFEEE